MNHDQLFDVDHFETIGMVRATDLDPAREAAVMSLSVVQANRLLILRLLVEHDWLTMFCPLVLTGDHRYKQTAIGPRFKRLRDEGMIEHIGSRRPRDGAESTNLVSAFKITDAGRRYLSRHE